MSSVTDQGNELDDDLNTFVTIRRLPGFWAEFYYSLSPPRNIGCVIVAVNPDIQDTMNGLGVRVYAGPSSTSVGNTLCDNLGDSSTTNPYTGVYNCLVPNANYVVIKFSTGHASRPIKIAEIKVYE